MARKNVFPLVPVDVYAMESAVSRSLERRHVQHRLRQQLLELAVSIANAVLPA